jgi:hypothetical protein
VVTVVDVEQAVLWAPAAQSLVGTTTVFGRVVVPAVQPELSSLML